MDFKIIKKLFSILFFILGLTFTAQSYAIAENCHRNADNKIVLDDTSDTPVSHDSGSNYDQDYCNEEPLFYKVKIGKLNDSCWFAFSGAGSNPQADTRAFTLELPT